MRTTWSSKRIGMLSTSSNSYSGAAHTNHIDKIRTYADASWALQTSGEIYQNMTYSMATMLTIPFHVHGHDKGLFTILFCAEIANGAHWTPNLIRFSGDRLFICGDFARGISSF
jgi:hypothetical protein